MYYPRPMPYLLRIEGPRMPEPQHSEHLPRFEPRSGHATAIRFQDNLLIVEPSAKPGAFWISGFSGGAAFYGREPVAASGLAREIRESAPFAFDHRCEVVTYKCEPVVRSWMERSLPEPPRESP